MNESPDNQTMYNEGADNTPNVRFIMPSGESDDGQVNPETRDLLIGMDDKKVYSLTVGTQGYIEMQRRRTPREDEQQTIIRSILEVTDTSIEAVTELVRSMSFRKLQQYLVEQINVTPQE